VLPVQVKLLWPHRGQSRYLRNLQSRQRSINNSTWQYHQYLLLSFAQWVHKASRAALNLCKRASHNPNTRLLSLTGGTQKPTEDPPVKWIFAGGALRLLKIYAVIKRQRTRTSYREPPRSSPVRTVPMQHVGKITSVAIESAVIDKRR